MKSQIECQIAQAMPRACSGRGCPSKAEYLLKLAVGSLGGYFCEKCAVELEESGLGQRVET